MFDMGDLHIPLNIAAKNDFYDYGISYWNKNHLAGTDLISEGYYWSNIVTFSLQFLIFPPWFAYAISKVFFYFISGYFTYKISKEYFNLPVLGCYFAGITFALIACNNDAEGLTSKALFPLVIFFLIKITNVENKIYWFFSIFLLALFYASGSFFVWDYISFLSIFLFCLYKVESKKNFIFSYILFCTIVMLYQLQVAIPILFNVGESHRISTSIDFNYIYFHQIFNEIVLGHWMNKQQYLFYIILLFSLYALFKKRFNNSNVNLLFYNLIFVLLFGLILPILQLFFKDIFPYINSIDPARAFKTSFHFFLVCLASHIFLYTEEITNKIGFKKSTILLSLIILSFISLPKLNNVILFLTYGHSFNNIFQSNALFELKNNNKENYRVAHVTKGPVHSNIQQNISMSYGLESATGYSSMHSERYDQFWKILTKGEMFGNRLYLFAPIKNGFNFKTNNLGLQEFDIESQYNINLLSLLNVKYFISDVRLYSPNLRLIHEPNYKNLFNNKRWRQLDFSELIKKIKYVHSGNNFYIYENLKVLPRFFIANNFKFFDSEKKLLDKLSISKIDYIKNNAYLEKKYQKNFDIRVSQNNDYIIKTIKYSPDKIIMDFETNNHGIFIVANSFSKFWTAKVDGEIRDIMPVYHTLWGVKIDKNDKNIVFEYKPPFKLFKNKNNY
tara:strand:+ start:3013 stop:5031 length:2019 start_codon:yes stop_codon:yes gene_type:complete